MNTYYNLLFLYLNIFSNPHSYHFKSIFDIPCPKEKIFNFTNILRKPYFITGTALIRTSIGPDIFFVNDIIK